MTDPVVFVIVLNSLNQWRKTVTCLNSLEELTYPSARVIVVDNGSSDDSVQRIRAEFPNTKILETGRNLGYAGGNNWGIRHARAAAAEYVWVLNNDTIVEPSALTQLVAAARVRPDTAIVASRLVDMDGTGHQMSAAHVQDDQYTWITCDGCDSLFHEADRVMGPSLLFRCKAFDEVGLMDESYFHYYEEIDIVERCRRQRWRLGLACRSTVRHEAGGTVPPSAQSHYYFIRNRLLFRRKLYGEAPLHILRSRVRLGHALQMRGAVTHGKWRKTVAGCLAIADAVRGRTGPRDLGEAYRWRDP